MDKTVLVKRKDVHILHEVTCIYFDLMTHNASVRTLYIVKRVFAVGTAAYAKKNWLS